jgi:hypothetical protein
MSSEGTSTELFPADEAQARLSHNERVEVDFETPQISMLRTTDDDDTRLP